MRQTAVFAFMVTKDGWIRLRTSISKIQPNKAAPPMQNASKANAIENVLRRAGSGCETSSGFIKRVTGSGSNCAVLRFQFQGSEAKFATKKHKKHKITWKKSLVLFCASLWLELNSK
jgi:hypothetical protein